MNQANTQARSLPRPPVVAVLGHVDHGKTSLLDKIRETNITAREAGGITQSIGAWQVTTPKNQVITFIDTPGHAAFQAMRARGAATADVAILVIAADDGVMPQTKQSLEYIKDSQTPFLVAITKIDLPSADLGKVKNQLLELEVVPEEYGGDVVVVPVSSKTGEGIENLLDMVVLLVQMHGLKGQDSDELLAYVLETERDPRRGVVASIIVKAGVLKVGDTLWAEGTSGKVKGLFDAERKSISEVKAGSPAEVIGFEALPPVGAVIANNPESLITTQKKREIPKIEGFAIVLKTDTAGSLEAILGQLSDKVGILFSGVGDINESDIYTASTAKTVIVGFNVKVAREVEKLAEEEKVRIYNYKIIYELISDVEKWLKESQEALIERILGKAQIIAKFKFGDKLSIAGCKVSRGRIIKTDRMRLVRGANVLGTIRVLAMKKQKEDISKAALNEEFGLLFEPQLDFQIGDVLESTP